MNPVKDPVAGTKNPEIGAENPARTRRNPVEPGRTRQDTVDLGIHFFRSLPGFAGRVRRCWAPGCNPRFIRQKRQPLVNIEVYPSGNRQPSVNLTDLLTSCV